MTTLDKAIHDGATRRHFLGRILATGAASLVGARYAVPAMAATPAEAPSQGWQIGCYTRPWAGCTYDVAFDAIAEAGYRHISFSGIKSATKRVIAPATPLEEAAKMGEEARRRGLQVATAYGGSFESDKSVAAGVAGLHRMIDNCAAARVGAMLIANMGNEKTYDNHCRAIAEACPYAVEKGVNIVLKPHGGLTCPGPMLRKAVEAVGQKNFTVIYDPGNIYYYSDGQVNPIEDVAVLDGLVTAMCVKDYRHPKIVSLTPGTGQVDFSVLMAKLIKGGFTHGPLIVETLAPGDLPHLAQEAVKARQFVEKLVAGA